MRPIPFHIPQQTGQEMVALQELITKGQFAGDGYFTQQVNRQLITLTKASSNLFTTSCTHSLELAALLMDIKEGDEIIMPSFTFVSTANAFVLRGAKIVFVDIRPDTMNINEHLIEAAITPKTKAIVPVHYAGVSCAMGLINALAQAYNLWVIEDAAQGIDAYYKNKHLGTLGHLGALSFHATKNIHCGEGGALLINQPNLTTRAETIREKGTNRGAFIRGEVDKYSWVDIGSSYLAGELPAAFLSAQLQKVKEVTQQRLALWECYYEQLEPLVDTNRIKLPFIPEDCQHNGHIFYIKCQDQIQRKALIHFLQEKGITAVFHYVPLHSAKAGQKFGRFSGKDIFTSTASECLLRLPLYPLLQKKQVFYICEQIHSFYKKV